MFLGLTCLVSGPCWGGGCPGSAISSRLTWAWKPLPHGKIRVQVQNQLAWAGRQPVPAPSPLWPSCRLCSCLPAPDTLPRPQLLASSFQPQLPSKCLLYPASCPGPEDPDLGRETDSPGERLAGQLGYASPRPGWAWLGLLQGSSQGPEAPGAFGTPTGVLPACPSPPLPCPNPTPEPQFLCSVPGALAGLLLRWAVQLGATPSPPSTPSSPSSPWPWWFLPCLYPLCFACSTNPGRWRVEAPGSGFLREGRTLT